MENAGGILEIGRGRESGVCLSGSGEKPSEWVNAFEYSVSFSFSVLPLATLLAAGCWLLTADC